MNDAARSGLHEKYKVERTDGSSGPGKKHDDCPYFVLDLEHDKYAKAALRAYADACKKKNPELAHDLRELMKVERDCGCRSAGHECGRFFGVPRKPSFGAGY